MSAPAKKKSDRMAWFKMDAGAFLADTTGLPAAHVGIYARLLMLYWASGNQLPAEDHILKRKLSVTTSEDEAVLDAVLAEFFPDRFHHGLDSQMDEVRANSKAQSERGKKAHQKPVQAQSVRSSTAVEDDNGDF